MKLSLLPQSYFPRRSSSNSFRLSPGDPISPLDTPRINPLWLSLHCLCCLVSLILGFRFSRVVFFLLFSSAATILSTLPFLHTTMNQTSSHVIVGRHGIRIRPWPHPNAGETMRAHKIIDRVQEEQRRQYGVKKPQPLIVITPTYVRTFQTLHLTALMHTLMLVPYDLTWVVVEAGGMSNETASILDRSQVNFIHVPFHEGKMPIDWAEQHRMEARMRLHALRVVRESRLDGMVVFADDSNIQSMELFDEIQKVKWIGTVMTVGILTQSSASEHNEEEKSSLIPIQGPVYSTARKFVGWQNSNPLSKKIEWAGIVLNSRLLWKDADQDRPKS